MNRDTEEIILGAWLLEEHLEDVKLFKPEDFEYLHTIAELYLEGVTDPLKLARKADVGKDAVGRITGQYTNYFYESAMREIAQDKARKWVFDNPKASPSEIADAMKMFERESAKVPVPTENLSQELQDEFDLRRTTPFVGTGISKLDYMLNGIRRTELTAVGARPSVGKSAFCQQVAINVARRGHRVLFFPLEMRSEALSERFFMRYVDFSAYSMRTGLTDEQWKDPQTAEAFNNLDELSESGNFLVFQRVNDLQEIRLAIRKYKPHMIVIDQLEQLKDGNMIWKDKRSRFNHMTHELQGMAMDEDVAVWLACQVNRDANDAPPTLANLKESGSIEEDSDNVILLHREGEDEKGRMNIRLELAKQRGGACGVVNLKFEPKKYYFYEETNYV